MLPGRPRPLFAARVKVQVKAHEKVQEKVQAKVRKKVQVMAPRVVAPVDRSARHTRAVAHMSRVHARVEARRRPEYRRAAVRHWVSRPARLPTG